MIPNHPPSPPRSLPLDAGIRPISARDAAELAVHGYVLRAPLLAPGLADALPGEIDRLIAGGVFEIPRDRVVAGQPTEWMLQLGTVWGRPVAHARSPLLERLWAGLHYLGRSYNAARQSAIEAGLATADALPALSPDGMELTVNRVVVPWSGLPLHTDESRFSKALRALGEGSVRHDAVLGRVLTVSGYARPRSASGRMNDLGGALSFVAPRQARNPGDASVFDIVPAHHDTGAIFLARTVHGVGRMPAGSVRYSFQAFFPSLDAWAAIAERIEAGDLEVSAARRGVSR